MERGFVTIATGNESYYKMAYHLLQSFRLFHPETPFAILCDRKNEYTEAFTDTVILEDAAFSYVDKFRILLDCPYEENIFIEPDCLVYHSLDFFWDLLSKQYDFTSFGWNDGKMVFFSDPAYAASKFLGQADAVTPIFNPGYMFIRNGNICRAIYNDAMRIIAEIKEDDRLNQDPRLLCKGAIRDDPVFFIAMALNGCLCTATPDEGKCISLPSVSKIYKISLSKGILDVHSHTRMEGCSILHFSSRRVNEEGLYLQQITVLELLRKHRYGLLVLFAESKLFYLILNIYKKITVRLKQLKRS